MKNRVLHWLIAIIAAVITAAIFYVAVVGFFDVHMLDCLLLCIPPALAVLCLWPMPVPNATHRLYRQRSVDEWIVEQQSLRQQLARLQAEYELQDSVFQVSAELVGCVEETDARSRFASALRTWWGAHAVDLFVWERGVWHTLGGDAQGDEPILSGPVRFPSKEDPDLTLDLSPAVAGQAAIVLRNARMQPSLRDHDANSQRYVADVLRGQLALSLRRVNLYLSLQRLGRTDPLTRCYRRWYGEQRLLELVDRGMVVAVAMIDVDCFKSINDDYGHAAGDQTLTAVGKALRSQLRTGDLVTRFGGEEFLVSLPDTGVHGALLVAERLRQSIESLVGLSTQVTVSIGVAALRIEESLEEILGRADQALYQAKDQGRNQVVLAEGDNLISDSPSTTGGYAVRTTQRQRSADNMKTSGFSQVEE